MRQISSRMGFIATSAASVLGAILLNGCATGQGSFVGGSGASIATDAILPEDDKAPGLLAVSGNALLPGARNSSAASILGVNTQPAGLASASLATPLATANLSVASLTGGPLLALNGSLSPLSGLTTVGVNSLTNGVTSTVGAVITPAIASTGLLATLGGVTQTMTGGGATGAPPMTAPVVNSRVPGATPLSVLVSNLTAGTGLLGH